MTFSTFCRLLVLITCLAFVACSPTPEKAFDIAVLNSNMVVGFANDGMEREMESPSVKMGKTKDEFAPMKRSEVVSDKINFLELSYKDIKGLHQTADTKSIIESSIALYEYILPVYKTDYTALAKLYDNNAPKQDIEKQKQVIREKYFPTFEKLYGQLISNGKSYAKEHDIKVNWAM